MGRLGRPRSGDEEAGCRGRRRGVLLLPTVFGADVAAIGQGRGRV